MTQIDLAHLPVGIYADGTPAYANLKSGNMMCQGEPGSGKSVMLSSLACSILRAEPQIQFAILSPKSLDFQNFMKAVPVIQDKKEMLAYLEWVQQQGEIRKQVCLDRHIKKIDKDLWDEYPPIVTMFDEFAMIHSAVDPNATGSAKNIGSNIENKLDELVAEMRFAAISNIVTTQRLGTESISSRIRDNMSGTFCSFSTNGTIANNFLWRDDADDAPCHKIKKSQVGCGYIAIGGEKPRAFKGAYCDEATGKEEKEAVEFYLKRKAELEAAGRPPFKEWHYEPPKEDDEDETPKRRGRRGR